ncbi:MAG: superoxide dismutase family protein [Gemmatimonadetes bacterium]|nr:superoxide dismutase family protein [Gemmatimonadota bacterium]
MDARRWWVGAAMLSLGGCALMGRSSGPVRDFALRDAGGAEVGTVRLQGASHGTRVTVRVHGLTPGMHGVHLHQTGVCEGPAFTSAGPHWNPTGKKHGWANPEGHHMGDLPNLTVNADGTGMMDFSVEAPYAAGPTSVLDADGSALVVHASMDDNKTDPSGNSGARIACAAITG